MRDNGVMSIETGLLAQGPIATVYAGRDPATGNDFAIKMFPGAFDRETSAWLERERKALAAVRSTRSVLQIDDVLTDAGGRSGVRRELCPGSLAGLLDSGARLGVPDVLALGAAIASALAAAHGADVLHGGVSPHNVLYRASGEFVLADFGVALRRRFPRDPMYAVEYTAPETLRDDTLSPASDLYGLGAVLYAALTGTPPFPRHTGQQPGERILQVLREPVAPIQDPGVPRELSATILRLLAKEPADRPQDVASLARLFTKLRQPGGEVVTAEPVDVPAEEEDVEFDDFAVVQRQPAAPSPVQVVQAPPSGGRTLIREFSGPLKTERRLPWKPVALAGSRRARRRAGRGTAGPRPGGDRRAGRPGRGRDPAARTGFRSRSGRQTGAGPAARPERSRAAELDRGGRAGLRRDHGGRAARDETARRPPSAQPRRPGRPGAPVLLPAQGDRRPPHLHHRAGRDPRRPLQPVS